MTAPAFLLGLATMTFVAMGVTLKTRPAKAMAYSTGLACFLIGLVVIV